MNRRYFLQSSLAGAVAACLPMGRLFADTPVVGAIEAVTGNGSPVSLEKAALQELKARLRGALLLRGEPGYDEARRVHPALLVPGLLVLDGLRAEPHADEPQPTHGKRLPRRYGRAAVPR